MTNTIIEEPTGLSPNNLSTAKDLVKMAAAAATYPQIAQMTTESSDLINVSGRNVEYRNTNRLVGASGWEIGLSKTGYTNEAGKCLIMQIKSAGKNATLVLLNAKASSTRIMDALNIRRFVAGEEAVPVRAAVRRAPRQRHRMVINNNTRVIKANLKNRTKAKPPAKPRRRRA